MTDRNLLPSPPSSIAPANTSLTAFLGRTPSGPVNVLTPVDSFDAFVTTFGAITTGFPLTDAVYDYFQNGGQNAVIARLGAHQTALSVDDYLGDPQVPSGLALLAQQGDFSLLCIPPDQRDGALPQAVMAAAAAVCTQRCAMLILDPPPSWLAAAKAGLWSTLDPRTLIDNDDARAAAIYFPRLERADVLQNGKAQAFPPCGAIAGVFAQSDATQGIWRAPAGVNLPFANVTGLEFQVSDQEQGQFAFTGVNALRSFTNFGPVIWGARTMRGSDQLQDSFKYIPVARLQGWMQRSIVASTRWVVFEVSSQAVWAGLNASIGSFLNSLVKQGAFTHFQVLCDQTNNTPDDIVQGRINVDILYDPLMPAEFMLLHLCLQAAPGTG